MNPKRLKGTIRQTQSRLNYVQIGKKNFYIKDRVNVKYIETP